MQFTLAGPPGRYGSFGALEWYDQPLGEAHKYTALMQYLTTGDVVTAVAEHKAQPHRFSLHQNYPNPFNPETTIRFELPHSADVRLTVYNLLGQRIVTLLDEHREEGIHHFMWNGTDRTGRIVPSGMYFYRLETPNWTETNKLLIIR